MAKNKEEANVFICGIPFDKNASVGKGASKAPEVLRALSYDLPPLDMQGSLLTEVKIHDFGDYDANNFDELQSKLEQEFFSANGFHVIFGGDHSIAIPAERAFFENCKKRNKVPVIIHMDAHPDICDEYNGNQ